MLLVAAVVIGGAIGSTLVYHGVNAAGKMSAEDSNYIKQDEIVEGSAYLAGDSVTVEGVIKGDLYCAGRTVKISGTVEGDIICAGVHMEVDGTSGGDMRLAGQYVTVRGESGGSVSVLADSFETEQTTKVSSDINGRVTTARLAGVYERDVAFSADSLVVVGEVARDIQGSYRSLKIADGAKVLGAMRYTGLQEAEISGEVRGEVSYQQDARSRSTGVSMVMMIASIFIGMLLLSFALAYVMPKRMDEIAVHAVERPMRALLWGFGAFMAVPLAGIILIFMTVGTMVGLFILAAWGLLLLLSGPLTGYVVGKRVFKKLTSIPARALAGGGVVTLLYVIPLVNILVAMAVMVFGSGMVLSYLESRGVFRRYKPTTKRMKGAK